MKNEEKINKNMTPESEKDRPERIPLPSVEESKTGSEKNQSELVQLLSSIWQMSLGNERMFPFFRKFLFVIFAILIILFTFFFFLYLVPELQEVITGRKHETTNISEFKNAPAYKKQMLLLDRDLQRLLRKFNAFTPGQSYLVINTTNNRFFLYRNKKLVREGFCSSGSYILLQTAEGSKHWVFKTPKGKFWIQQKITSPLWKRPDWSFVEEGLPIPPPDAESRFEYGVLGDYALSLGDGYLIHGTIYKRFLGMPVTHGCIRLNDDDLKTIYNILNIGSKVYIF